MKTSFFCSDVHNHGQKTSPECASNFRPASRFWKLWVFKIKRYYTPARLLNPIFWSGTHSHITLSAIPDYLEIQDFLKYLITGDNPGVIIDKYSAEEKSTPPKKKKKYLLRSNYSPSTYLILNKYSLQEISTPLDIVWRVVFSHLNTFGSSIFLGICNALWNLSIETNGSSHSKVFL